MLLEACNTGDSVFISAEAMNDKQLLFVTAVYGYVLYQASNLIAEGSELLLFVPSVAGLVGSVVLPILGAVPDGMIVLFSGLGDDAQAQVSVGMGAQAGSTVMLLTIPWFIAIWFGQVPIGKDGEADYKDKKTEGGKRGVSFERSIHKNCMIMILTTLLFLVIQIPATLYESTRVGDTKLQAYGESKWALIGLVCCLAGFCGYLVYCFKDSNEDKKLALLIEGVQNHQVSLGAALKFLTEDLKRQAQDDGEGQEAVLLARTKTKVQDMTTMKKVLKPFFAKYDYNKDGSLGVHEVKPLLFELNMNASAQNIEVFFGSADSNKDRMLSFEEFITVLYNEYMIDEHKLDAIHHHCNPKFIPAYDDEEEEEDIPEELVDQDPAVQLRKIIVKACKMMGFGTFLIVLFSDPMVECLSSWGTRTGIPSFYISFVIAPFCSNASELIAAMNYGAKKTKQGISVALSTLVGAACMNNTFCLGIFMAIVYFQGLAWTFTAETVCCVVVQWIIGLFALKSTTMSTVEAMIILSSYPLCLAGVWFMENVLGFD